MALFSLGTAKVLVTKSNALRSGIEMLFVGALAAFVAFGVGMFLKDLVSQPVEFLAKKWQAREDPANKQEALPLR